MLSVLLRERYPNVSLKTHSLLDLSVLAISSTAINSSFLVSDALLQIPLVNSSIASSSIISSSHAISALFSELLYKLSTHQLTILASYAYPQFSISFSDVLSFDENVLIKARHLLRTAYKLIAFNPSLFSSLWDWSDIFKFLSHPDIYVRAYASHCVSILTNMVDFESSKFLSNSLENQNSDTDFTRLLFIIENEINTKTKATLLSAEESFIFTGETLSDLCVNFCGIPLLKLNSNNTDNAYNTVNFTRLLHTPTTKKNLNDIGMGLALGLPILLEGDLGSGKSGLVYESASIIGCINDLVTIHLGDQSDSKLLLGSYVCTPKPGVFAWLPGILTTAVQSGNWVLFEDIDLAPPEILSILIPLLESRSLFIPGRGEKIKAKEGFQIFATRMKVGRSGMMGESLWMRVSVRDIPSEEIGDIIRNVLSSSSSLEIAQTEKKIIDTVVAVQQSQSEKMWGSSITTRDILKWTGRILTTLSQNLPSAKDRNENIYLDAWDSFSYICRRNEEFQTLRSILSETLSLDLHRITFFETVYNPEFSKSKKYLQIGRSSLPINNSTSHTPPSSRFAMTTRASRLLEKLSVCIHHQEPVLLIGETGTGKTTIVQFLANSLNQPLIVINLSQQSESGDLIGGYKPVDTKSVLRGLMNSFIGLMERSFKPEKVGSFVEGVRDAMRKQKEKVVLKGFRAAVDMVERADEDNGEKDAKRAKGDIEKSTKSKKGMKNEVKMEWKQFKDAVEIFEKQYTGSANDSEKKSSLFFQFVEGALIRALKTGAWVLLDEINLASSETLESLNGLLSSPSGSLLLLERGDTKPVPRHPSFRLFAAMNPATDSGKRELSRSLKTRFTSFWVPSPAENPEDLRLVISQYLQSHLPSLGTQSAGLSFVNCVAEFYTAISRMELYDAAANQKVGFSMRTLVRALLFAISKESFGWFGLKRAVREGLEMCFCTMLEDKNKKEIEAVLDRWIPKEKDGRARKGLEETHVIIDNYWVEKGQIHDPAHAAEADEKYVLTESVKGNLKNLARAVMARQFPVLIQGPTSAGKTSMVEYLAKKAGHKFVRINNHEHTDLQEYLGMYAPDKDGRLIFHEGVLVQALRQGHWLVLDELNLAPTDVLEALNRLLDDNRELFIPETQEVITPHPSFMLFATQNPAGSIYGGRKQLSRAFRNRFVELYFDQIPETELESILSRRCQIAPSYATKMVKVYRSLSSGQGTAGKLRSRIFDSKGTNIQGVVTLRDLFRWAGRGAESYQQLAEDGYMILAERIRRQDDKQVVKNCIEKEIFGKEGGQIKEDDLYKPPAVPNGDLVWTRHTRRLYSLVERAVKFNEPVLLVGETGTGKTSVVHVIAAAKGSDVKVVNVHQNSETADFLGGQRPVRSRDTEAEKLKLLNEGKELMRLCGAESNLLQFDNLIQIVDDAVQKFLNSNSVAHEPEMVDAGLSKKQKRKLNKRKRAEAVPIDQELKSVENEMVSLQLKEKTVGIDSRLERLKASVAQLLSTAPANSGEKMPLFEWHDGPLIQSMKNGSFFLLDEISLADDSVLERLNSVLEPQRLLVLAEKGTGNEMEFVEEITASSGFQFLATMNPGGDYGKKELSPALRNRFTEIWVPAVSSREDLTMILENSLASSNADETILLTFAVKILDFVDWFSAKLRQTRESIISMRDLLAWVKFIRLTWKEIGHSQAFMHGGLMVLVDGIGVNPLFGVSAAAGAEVAAGFHHKKDQGDLEFEVEEGPGLLAERLRTQCERELEKIAGDSGSMKPTEITIGEDFVAVNPFSLKKGPHNSNKPSFSFNAPTVLRNTQRVIRALQLQKPILLEGSPGVGKTSLISSLASLSGNGLVRINLSEQTDLSDLFGADLPVENSSEAGHFSWRDGPFLSAMKNGDWVLLDELNLASQPVLEGLNAVLDHRAEVYIPELDRTFPCASGFRVFAAQNPHFQGGGRKGLPKSFANRFTQVYVDPLNKLDLMIIGSYMHSTPLNAKNIQKLDVVSGFNVLDKATLRAMVNFVNKIHVATMVKREFGTLGQPWEFNLRDVMRWVELMNSCKPESSLLNANRNRRTMIQHQMRLASIFVDMLFVQRMRTRLDQRKVSDLFVATFAEEIAAETGLLHESHQAEFREILNKRWHCSVTPKQFRLAHAVLPRGNHTPSITENVNGNSDFQILRSQLNPLAAVTKCVEMNWLVLVTGPSASGKTMLVRTLSNLVGRQLQEFAMNSAVDTVELLGGFEQVDPVRRKRMVANEAKWCADAVIRELLIAFTSAGAATKTQIEQTLVEVYGLRDKFLVAAATNVSKFDVKVISNIMNYLLEVCGHYNLSIEDKSEVRSAPHPSLVLRNIARYNKWADSFGMGGDNLEENAAGRFEWVDGLLLKALENGDWVVLDNVNLCSASVLDRLNPLFEPNGCIEVTERGLMVDDDSDEPKDENDMDLDNKSSKPSHIKVIRPHPNFRMFMLMDPKYGEISRAMRNRAVEISLVGSDWLGDSYSLNLDVSSGFPNDFHFIMNQLGVIGVQLPSFLRFLSCALSDSKTDPETFANLELNDIIPLQPIDTRKLLLTAKFVIDRVQQGLNVKEAVNASVAEIYPNNESLNIDQCWNSYFTRVGNPFASFTSASIFPHFLSGFGFAAASTDSKLLQHSIPLVFNLFTEKHKLFQSVANACHMSTSDIKSIYPINNAMPSRQQMLQNCGEIFLVWVLFSPIPNVEVNVWLNYLSKLVRDANDDEGLEAMEKIKFVYKQLEDRQRIMIETTSSQLSPLIGDLIQAGESGLDIQHSPFLYRNQHLFGNMDTWKNYLSCLNAGKIFILIAFLEAEEMQQKKRLQSMNNSMKLKELSVLDRSLAFHEGFISESQLLKPFVKYFSPFFTALREDLTLCNQSLGAEEIYTRMETLIRLLQSLRTILNSQTLLFNEIFILCRRMNKGLNHMGFGKSSSIFSEIALALDLDFTSAFISWWKQNALTCIKFEDLEICRTELMNLNSTLRINPGITSQDRLKHLSLFINPEQHRTITEGISTLFFLNETSEIPKDMVNAVAEVHGRLRIEFESLQAEVETKFSKVVPLRVEGENMEETKFLIPLELFKIINENLSRTQLDPIFSNYALSVELQLLSRIACIMESGPSRTNSNELASILPAVRDFYHFAITNTLLSPSCLEPWQRLIWMCDESNDTFLLEKNKNRFLRTIFHDALVEWHKQTWRLTYPNVQDSLNHAPVQSPKYLFQNNIHTSFDYPKINTSLRSDYCFRTLLSGENCIPIHYIDVKQSELKKIKSLLCNKREDLRMLNPFDFPLILWNLKEIFLAISLLYQKDLRKAFDDSIKLIDLCLEEYEFGSNLSTETNKKLAFIRTAAIESFKVMPPCPPLDHLRKYLFPLLDMVGELDVARIRWKCWIYLSMLMLRLSQPPSSAIDPASIPIIKLRFLEESSQNSLAQLTHYVQTEYLTTSQTVSGEISSCLDRLQMNLRLYEKMSSSIAVRPIKSQMKELTDDLIQCIANVTSDDAIFGLLENCDRAWNYEPPLSNLMRREQFLQENLESVVTRLSSKYSQYRDIIQPVCLAFHQLKSGFRQYALGIFERHRDREFYVLKSMLPIIDTISDDILEKIRLDFEQSEMTFPSTMSKINTYLALLHRQQAKSLVIKDRFYDNAKQLFSMLIAVWEDSEAIRLQKEREADELYKYKERTHTFSTDEDVDLAEFTKQFPDYSEEFADLQSREVVDASSTPPLKKSTEMNETLFNDEISMSILQIHQSMLKSTTISFSEGWQLAVQKSFSACVTIISNSTLDLPREIDDLALHAQLMEIARFANNLSTDVLPKRYSALGEEIPYNFYQDPNVPEAKILLPILVSFSTRLSELLEQWPDHYVLIQLSTLCERIGSFSLNSPISKLITGLEMLLQKCEDWESFASSAVSIKKHMEDITQLIIQWRKLELQSWRQLLQVQDQQAKMKASKLWFHLFNTVSKISTSAEGNSTELISEFLASLDQLCHSSPLGEFETRLQLLRLFHEHLTRELNFNPFKSEVIRTLVDLLGNVCSYYVRFASNVDNSVATQAKSILKELNEYVRIASWKDVNVFALKASSTRTHQHLHKFIKKYRLILDLPVKDVMQSFYTNENVSDAFSHFPLKVDASVNTQSVMSKLDPPSFENFPVASEYRVSKLPQLFGRMRSISTQLSIPKLNDTIHSMESLVGNVIERVKEFQASSGELEAGTSRTKAEKNIRRKAWVDLLKHLQHVGLSSRCLNIYSEQRENIYIFSLPHLKTINMLRNDPDALHNYAANDETLTFWDRADLYYYRILTSMAPLRDSTIGYSNDITGLEVEKAQSFIEHMLHLIIEERKLISLVEKSYAPLKQVSDRYSSLYQNLKSKSHPLTLLDKVDGVICIYQNLFDAHFMALSQAQLVCKSLEESENKVILKNELQSHLDVVVRERNELNKFTEKFKLKDGLNACVVDDKLITLLVGMKERASDVKSKLGELASKYDEVKLIRTLLTELEPFYSPLISTDLSIFNNTDIREEKLSNEIYLAFDAAVESILVGFQNLKGDFEKLFESTASSLSDENDIESDENSMKHCHNCIKNIWSSINIDRIHLHLTQLFELIVATNNIDNSNVIRLLVQLYPLLQQFLLAVQRRMQETITFNKSLAKTAYVLCKVFTSVFKKGFCLPESETPEGEEDDKSKPENATGLGLGEGEGEKDVSEEIEDQSQVEGLKDEKQETTDSNRPIPEQKNAIEMDDIDFDGKLEDVEPKEGDEGEQEEDGEDENENEIDMDDQMGEVDKDKADVVDEKMWDENDEKDTKGEDYEEGAEVEGGVSEMVGNEDQKPDKKKKESKEEDSQNHQEDAEGPESVDENEEGPVNDLDNINVEENHGIDVKPSDTQEESTEDDALDLPDDMQLDNDGENENEGEENDITENDPESGKDPMNVDEEHFEQEVGEDVQLMDEIVPDNEIDDENQPEAEKEKNEQSSENMAMDESAGAEGDKENEEKQEPSHQEELISSEQANDNKAVAGIEGVAGMKAPVANQNGSDETSGKSEDAVGQSSSNNDGAAQSTSAGAEPSSKPNEDRGTNSHRSLGDTLKKWMSRMKISEENTANQNSEADKRDDNDAENRLDDNMLYEFVKEDENAADGQGLADATAEQIESMTNEERQAIVDKENAEETDLNIVDEEMEDVQENDRELLPDLSQNDKKSSSYDSRPAIAPPKKQKESETLAESATDIEESTEKTDGPTSEVVEGKKMQHEEEEGYIDLEPETYLELRSKLESNISDWRQSGQDPEKSETLWHTCSIVTRELAFELCEQLRLILEPTLATKLKGDYRTGKRLNMRKIIPYIASDYKKDKIWLRRTKPSKRTYQVMIAIDDSRSMAESKSIQLAYESLALISKALTQLEVGELAVLSFGEEVRLLHPFETPFSDDSGAGVIQQFTFRQEKTHVKRLVETSMGILQSARDQQSSSRGSEELWQLEIIISDGVCEDHQQIRRMVKRAAVEQRIMMVFVVIDKRLERDSIANMTNVKYEFDDMGKPVLKLERYMDTFPFDNYIILRDIEALPEVLSETLRQYFMMVSGPD